MFLLLFLHLFAAKYTVRLSWDASLTPKAKTYYVYRNVKNGAFKRIASTNNTSYTDTSAPAGTVQYYITTYYKTESAPTKPLTVTLP